MAIKRNPFKKSMVPNGFTFLNLALGILAILDTIRGHYLNAGLFILAAGIVDRYDGRIARMIGAESTLGRELDSLADNVSFGVAPAILVYQMHHFDRFGFLGYLIIVVFCLCGTFRLARYNSVVFDGTFTGVPITIAGPTLTIFAIINQAPGPYYVFFLMALAVFLGWLMVSSVHFKKR
ncbi:CDP-diacylglycerol--serine O-phosphatidyltransferase [Clostridiaceae bacterium JG1575]|nr:CDP-diacylglycerol--serine O-phosphatidyltransferase [Clostridiaceae bacterium JG1575]